MVEKQPTDNSKSNQSTEKVLQIIELLADKGNPMRLLDISKELGYNMSTARRFLTSLISCGYVSQDKETSRYYLTYKICGIANKIARSSDVREIAHPYLKQISRVFEESVCLAVEQEMSVIYIDVVEGPDQMLRTMQRIGNVAPMHCTGIGKLLLLNYSEDRLDRLIAEKGLPEFTRHTLTTKERLMAELREIRRCGYAYDNEECEIGARCVAFPLWDYTGKVVAGLSVTGPVGRMNDAAIERNMELLTSSAEEVSRILGGKEWGATH